MDKTIKDIKKITNTGSKYLKTAIYYGYLPLILYLGFKTVNFDNFKQQAQPMWSKNQVNSMILFIRPLIISNVLN